MKHSFTTILLLITLTFSFMNVHAQEQDSSSTADQIEIAEKNPNSHKKNLADRIYFGGTISMTFGNYTLIGIHPMVGYKLTSKLSLGLKLGYEYIIDKRSTNDYTAHNYGLSVFTRYRIIMPIYLHAEYAQMNYDLYYGMAERVWVPFLFVGGGYSQRLGSRNWLNFQVLFDVLQDKNSPYTDWTPFISLGIGVGF